MNKRIKQLIALGVLSFTLISNQFTVYAEINKPIQPIQPEAPSGKLTNKKIKEYNKQVDIYNSEVDIYNKEVDDYNKQIDELYEKELEEVNQKNKEIEEHNKAEQKKVEEIKKINAQRQKEYDEAYAQYEKDLEIENKIKEKGFESVEAYNQYIITNFNNPANLSVEKNAAESAVFSIDKCYTVTKAEIEEPEPEEPSEDVSGNDSAFLNSTDEGDIVEDNDVKVHIEHNFPEIGVTYSTDFTIKESDTITFYAAGAQMETTQPGYAAFYMHTDDSHSMGYWSQSYSTLYATANISESGWNCGDSHTVSYREGKKHASDSTDIDIIYNYYWTPLKVYKTYNVPVKPILELIEYTPNFLEKLKIPEKEKHLELLDYLEYMKLLPELPKPEPENPQPAPEITIIQEETQQIVQTYNQPILQPIVSTPTPTFSSPPQARRAETSDSYYEEQTKKYCIIIICIIVIILAPFIFKDKDPHK